MAMANVRDVSIEELAIDLGTAEGCERLAAELSGHGYVPDVVINNAGFGLAGRAAELERQEQLQMIDLNIRALTDLTLRFLPGMLARRGGGIINVASVAAFMPGPGMAVYFASKAYVLSFTDALAEELLTCAVLEHETGSPRCPSENTDQNVGGARGHRCDVGGRRGRTCLPSLDSVDGRPETIQSRQPHRRCFDYGGGKSGYFHR